MGKNYQGINGNFSGKIGPTVGRVKNGRTITAIYQPVVANPRTTKQTSNRTWFTKVVKTMRAFIGWSQVMCRSEYQYGTPWSNLLKLVFNSNAKGGTATDPELLYNKILISKGGVAMPYSPSGAIDSQSLNASWTDNTGEGGALASDVCCLMVYNSAKNAAVFTVNGGSRESRQGTLTLPTAWSGDSVDTWMAFRREDNTEQSDSVYLGNFSI